MRAQTARGLRCRPGAIGILWADNGGAIVALGAQQGEMQRPRAQLQELTHKVAA